MSRKRDSFNHDWRFHKGDVEDAQHPHFADTDWRAIRLPHDWAIEGPFDIKYNARSGGLPFHGVGWYRKSFEIPATDKGKVVAIEFDGAMNNSEVWINGHYLGIRPYGYIGFEYDLSEYLNYEKGETNLIAVKLSPEDLSSRWYPGAGLYRNVWINTKESIHVGYQGSFVTSEIDDEGIASVKVRSEIESRLPASASIDLKTEILDATGEFVASLLTQDLSIDKPETVHQQLSIDSPTPWDLDNPYLYTAVTTIYQHGEEIDRYETPFGIRAIHFDPKTGFQLNGKKVRLNGVCMHHDLGPLGTAVNRRATERQLQIMKSMGVNAIRTSHNPPSPEQLEFCDRLGLLIQVESFDVWEIAKVENGYNKYFEEWHERDLRDMIRRDRNHPSVIMWSIGNEILEQSQGDRGATIARRLNDICHEEDPTRPTTAGFNHYPESVENGLAAEVDLVGFNYKPIRYREVQKQHPDWIIYGAETSSCVSSRGTYHLPIEKYEKHESLEVSSYDLIGPAWAYPPDVEFHYLDEMPEALGEFVWTGFDYLGEPTPYGGRDNSTNGYWNDDWPARSSYFGTVDLCGFPKDRYYLYQSQWSHIPMVHLLPHWNWEGKEGEEIPVYGYTNCEEAELFLNGVSLGRKKKGRDTTELQVKFLFYEGESFESKFRLSWNVPYKPGTLRMIGYNNGKPVCEKSVSTAHTPSRVSLEADRAVLAADGDDLSFIAVRIEDVEGNLCPCASNLVRFTIRGAGEIAAVGNGFPATEAPFQAKKRKAFNGLCMVIVRTKPNEAGPITVTASSRGLLKCSASLRSVSPVS